MPKTYLEGGLGIRPQVLVGVYSVTISHPTVTPLQRQGLKTFVARPLLVPSLKQQPAEAPQMLEGEEEGCERFSWNLALTGTFV